MPDYFIVVGLTIIVCVEFAFILYIQQRRTEAEEEYREQLGSMTRDAKNAAIEHLQNHDEDALTIADLNQKLAAMVVPEVVYMSKKRAIEIRGKQKR